MRVKVTNSGGSVVSDQTFANDCTLAVDPAAVPVSPPPPPPSPPSPPPSPPPVPVPPPPDPVPVVDEHEAAMNLIADADADLLVPLGQTVELGGVQTLPKIKVYGTLTLLAGLKLRTHTFVNVHGLVRAGTDDQPIPLASPIEITLTGDALDPKDVYQLGRGIIWHGSVHLNGELPAVRAKDTAPADAADPTKQSRAITVRSADPTARGHTMVMLRNDFLFRGVAFLDLGRTSKAVPVTDPDGRGGGLGNVRGRYPCHIHHGGETGSGTVEGCYVNHSPGLGIVLHDSRGTVKDCVTYDVFGTHIFAESGTEVGAFDGNLCVKSTGAPDNGSQLNDDRGNRDFGWRGHGIWLQGGGVSVTNNVCVGHRQAIACVSEPLTPDLSFDISALPSDTRTQIDPNYVRSWTGLPLGRMRIQEVPLQMSGNTVSDSETALALYECDPAHHAPAGNVSHLIENETYGGRISLGYITYLHLKNVVINVGDGTTLVDPGFCAIDHSSMGSQWVIENVTIAGFKRGLRCPTAGANKILGGHFDCERGIVIEPANRNDPLDPSAAIARTLEIDGAQTFGPRTLYGYDAELATFRWTIDWLKSPGAADAVWKPFFAHDDANWQTPIYTTDNVTVGGARLSHEELGDSFSFAELVGLPDAVRLKSDGSVRTTADARADLNLVVCGRTLPADAHHRTGHRGWFHAGPAVLTTE